MTKYKYLTIYQKRYLSAILNKLMKDKISRLSVIRYIEYFYNHPNKPKGNGKIKIP